MKTQCVYRFINIENKIIYIGKASKLSKRINSNGHNNKHLPEECYSNIVAIEYVQFHHENDMNFAEKYYVQKYQPKYNNIYLNKQITIDVPKLDNKNWITFSYDENKLLKQINDFTEKHIIKHSEQYWYVSMNMELDILDFILYFSLQRNTYINNYLKHETYMKQYDTRYLVNNIEFMRLDSECRDYRKNKLKKIINIGNEIKGFQTIGKNNRLLGTSSKRFWYYSFEEQIAIQAHPVFWRYALLPASSRHAF